MFYPTKMQLSGRYFAFFRDEKGLFAALKLCFQVCPISKKIDTIVIVVFCKPR